MRKFRKKPIVVEAFRWLHDEAPEWWTKAKGVGVSVRTESLFIPTPEGIMTANRGDYIIQGVKGEIYPCKPDIFELTYEEVDQCR